MRVETLTDLIISPNSKVKVKEMGNVTEIMYMDKINGKATIRKIDNDTYVVLSTGEKGEFNHIDNRAQLKKGLYKTLSRLREILNTNIVDVKNCRWITLTYKDNMTDPKKLYEDFKKFNMRYRYRLKQENKDSYEYIVAMEPQGRGAWHCHCVFIFPEKAPYIKNEELRDLWGHGFVTVKKLDDVDNVGAYLTAYLGDMDIEEAQSVNMSVEGSKCKIVDCEDEKGNKIKKCYVKGARLNMYPPKFNLYRKSKGIKEPIVYMTTNEVATKKVSACTLTFEKSIKIIDDEINFNKIINYKYYNNKIKK